MREIGLHLRLNSTLADVFAYAQQLEISAFQCFLIHQSTHHYYVPSADEILTCKSRAAEFKKVYLHGAYGINFADATMHKQYTFDREWKLANKLGFTHYVLHPGSFKYAPSKEAAIETLAKNIDRVLEYESAVQIIIENSAHGGKAIGGDFHDFALLKQAMRHASRVQFCLDTAHAFVYGYDIVSEHGRHELLKTIDTTVGLSSISLIHCNDTTEVMGSKIDKHEIPGNGRIGIHALHSLLTDDALCNVPIIMELPELERSSEREIIALVQSW